MIYIPMKVRHEVKALAAGRIFEFYITDDIKPDGERFNWDTYSWEAVESTTCQRYFVENTKDAQAGDTINLYINSWGGSVKEALGIYNVLRRCGATVVAYIDGVAASAASVIAMAADKVIMPRNTAMMVHNAAWGVYGNSKELRKSADDLDIINGAMLQSYIVKAGDKLPAEKLEELTDGETCLPDILCHGLPAIFHGGGHFVHYIACVLFQHGSYLSREVKICHRFPPHFRQTQSEPWDFPELDRYIWAMCH